MTSVSDQLWHVHTNKKVRVVNRRYSNSSASWEEHNEDWAMPLPPDALPWTPAYWNVTDSILKAKLKCEQKNKWNSFLGFFFSFFISPPPAEKKSQDWIQFIILGLGVVSFLFQSEDLCFNTAMFTRSFLPPISHPALDLNWWETDKTHIFLITLQGA